MTWIIYHPTFTVPNFESSLSELSDLHNILNIHKHQHSPTPLFKVDATNQALKGSVLVN